ncbi:MAG: hypothetical protein AAFN74_25915 [Myxococcota bacterium]
MRALRLLTWTSLVVLTIGGCSCESDTLTPVPIDPPSCQPDTMCGQGEEYRRGTCRVERCVEDADCCPGQICSVVVGLCADQTIACTADSECAENPGQTCIDFRGGQFCGYPNRGNVMSDADTQACAGNEDCDPGRSCVGQRCVVFAPCNGGCPDGEVCDVDTNVCFEEPSCTETCGEGEILVVADPDSMSGPQCCAVECACVVLPPVQPGQFGWFTDLAADAQQLVASGYDPIYGDLVVGRYDESGTLLNLEYVDGFPSTGPIVGNPAGARGGRIDAGPNVGEHTSVAIDATGTVHVAYYDRDAGDLRYANGTAGNWTVSVVDTGFNVGLYTSIAVGRNGRPRIAYMMAEGTIAPDPTPRTALKLATASTDLPASANDWSIDFVDDRPLPPPACGGPCDSDELCSDLGLGIEPACFAVASTAQCVGCGSGTTCVEVATNDFTCAEAFEEAPSDDFIEGVGLFASLAITSTGTAVIAYYDRIDGDLKLARSNVDGGFGIQIIDGFNAADPNGVGPDVGQHASIAIGPRDRIAIAYFDATNDDLVYFDLAERTRTVVDDGVSPPDLRFVGADADLVFDERGEPSIAYQDPTLIDLLYARRIGGSWSTEIVRGSTTAISSGFYAAQAQRGDTAFVGGVDVSFDTEGTLLRRLVIAPRAVR